VWKVTGYTECTKTCGGGNFSVSVFFLFICVYILLISYPESTQNTKTP
jgi:hypothetical protein